MLLHGNARAVLLIAMTVILLTNILNYVSRGPRLSTSRWVSVCLYRVFVIEQIFVGLQKLANDQF